MHDDLSCEAADELANRPARTVLAVLLSRHPGVVAVEELVREIALAPTRSLVSEPAVHDGIADLVGDGLAQRLDEGFVMATQAAVRASDLLE